MAGLRDQFAGGLQDRPEVMAGLRGQFSGGLQDRPEDIAGLRDSTSTTPELCVRLH
jgi:hypothetical protein